jgi:hypothetical protein
MSIGQQPIQLLGFYLAGMLCLGSAVLKLTLEGHWSWWRVLLPLWTVLGHNILYIVVGFIWLSFASPGLPGEEDITIREDAPQRYEFAAMLCACCSPITCSSASKERASGCGYDSERVNGSCFSYWVCSA